MREIEILGVGLCLLVGGCALSPEERQDIIEASSDIAAERAASISYSEARDAGLSPADAEKVSDLAREAGREAAQAAAARLIPAKESGKRNRWGAAIASALVAVLQMFAGMSRKVALG